MRARNASVFFAAAAVLPLSSARADDTCISTKDGAVLRNTAPSAAALNGEKLHFCLAASQCWDVDLTAGSYTFVGAPADAATPSLDDAAATPAEKAEAPPPPVPPAGKGAAAATPPRRAQVSFENGVVTACPPKGDCRTIGVSAESLTRLLISDDGTLVALV